MSTLTVGQILNKLQTLIKDTYVSEDTPVKVLTDLSPELGEIQRVELMGYKIGEFDEATNSALVELEPPWVALFTRLDP